MIFRAVVSVAVAVALSAGGSAPPARIVAIGDVHGASERFVTMLTRAGLIDAQRRWAGGKTVFVQTGDVTDRGAGVREALDLLMALERQASSAGGKVHVLVGNHEMMNMLGDLRDVSPAAIADFGGDAAYRAAFARDGKYGRWLRSKPILVDIDGTVFMHAGIDLEFTTEPLDALNRRARRELEQWDDGVRLLLEKKLIQPGAPLIDVATAARLEVERLNAIVAKQEELPADAQRIATVLPPVANVGLSSLAHPEGPLWFRGFATWTDAEGAAKMAALLKHHRVKRFVTGHNPQADGRIRERFSGALFLIDTGMLGGKHYPAGRPSALDLQSGRANPIYVE